jgi:tetratricopeptide (TPR) repeat protein
MTSQPYNDALLRVPVVRLGELEDPYALGVDREAPEAERHGYVKRDRELDLREGLQEAADQLGQGEPVLVVVSGPSNAGKTRMLYEVARKTLKDAYVVAPHNKQCLKKLTEPGRLPEIPDGPIVLWLEDLELYVGTTGEEVASPLELRSIWLAGRRNIILLGTVGGKARSDLSGKDVRRIRNPLVDLLGCAQTRIDLANEMTGAEIDRAREKGYSQAAIEQIRREGIGEYMIAAPLLIEKLNTACHPGDKNTCLEGAAVVLAAIDWRRAGIQRPIPKACLEKLYSYYLRGAEPNSERFKVGVAWGERELYATSRLISYETSGASSGVSDGYQPHDAVVQHIQATRDESIPNLTFETILKECASMDDVFALGLTAYGDRLIERALLCFQRADERGSAKSAFALGVLLEGRGDVDGAEAALRRADERGDADGAFGLGVLLGEHGDLDDAEAAFRRADERGSASGALNLGVLLEGRGDSDGAEGAFRRADERGDADGAVHLGDLLLKEHSDLDGAEAAYRRADERSSAEGAFNLGVLLEGRGDSDGAEGAFRRADERGSASGAFYLGDLLRKERGDVDGAEAAYRRADERDHAGGAHNLGVLLERERGDLDGAEAAYRRADRRSSAEGAYNLGVLLERRGDSDGAKDAFRRADERGSAAGAYNLGVLLEGRDDVDGAEAAYRRADERDHAGGAHNLGVLLRRRGDLKGAEAAYHRADERGSADGAVNLGALLGERGDSDGAEGAFRRADERGSAAGAYNLAVLLLKEGGDLEGAEAAYRRARERGWDLP